MAAVLARTLRSGRRATAALFCVTAALAFTACFADAPGKKLTDAARAECVMRGGTPGRGGLFPDELCFMPMKDAGQSCKKADDCDGICLAETGTCSTVSPIFGCYDYLDEKGRIVGICVD